VAEEADADRSRTRRSHAAAKAADAVNAPIVAGEMYRSKDAQARLGIKSWGWRQLKRKGLKTIKVANRSYALGSEIIRHFEAMQENAGNDR
jgi:hypothetical protein